MIYPAVVNIVILQDSTYEQDFIITEAAKASTLNENTNTITSACHGFLANDRVALSVTDGELPCGITATQNYFVLAAGLTEYSFQISTTSGGSAVDFTITSPSATYQIGRVIDLTTYTFDADIRLGYGLGVSASFVCTATNAVAGRLRLSLTAGTTQALAAASYVWDLKLISASSSYFYAKGSVTVEATSSRT
jgi:hypothetical protein